MTRNLCGVERRPGVSSVTSQNITMHGQATNGAVGVMKNKPNQSAAAEATSVTKTLNNTVDESGSMQLSAADCGEWLLGRVLSALLLLLADKKSENNNNDDDDANDDSDGEKKAANEVRSLLLAWRAWARRLWNKQSKSSIGR